MSKEHESFIYDKEGRKYGPIRFAVSGTSGYDLLNAMPINDENELKEAFEEKSEVALDKGLRAFFETLTPEQIESLNEEE